MDKHISVKSINVKKFRIVCIVEVANNYLYSNDKIKDKLLKICPTLLYHKCKNSHNNNFIDELGSTMLPHVFEHLIIDLQIKELSNKTITCNQQILGTSQWINKDNGLAKVELSYVDDLLALKAIKEAQEIINSL